MCEHARRGLRSYVGARGCIQVFGRGRYGERLQCRATGKYDTKFNSKAYLHRLLKLIAIYQIKPIFVHKELSGQMIYEILYRELKNRLESGMYG